jgi:type IV fimbrial biogenesis protein FimT
MRQESGKELPPSGRSRRAPPDASGVTLVELMVVLAVAAVLMAAGAPALGDFLRNQRLQGGSVELVQSLHQARSEAAKRRQPVVLCRSLDPLAATPTCTAGPDWSSGWLVFASASGGGGFDPATDTLLRVVPPRRAGISVRANPTATPALRYNPDGTTDHGGGIARFALCDARGGASGREVSVPPVGRPRVGIGAPGAEVSCASPA